MGQNQPILEQRFSAAAYSYTNVQIEKIKCLPKAHIWHNTVRYTGIARIFRIL